MNRAMLGCGGAALSHPGLDFTGLAVEGESEGYHSLSAAVEEKFSCCAWLGRA